MRWGGEFLVKHNASQYTTHALGPVFGWMNIGCGDYYDKVVSMANRSLGINHYFATKFGPNHPNAKRKYAQGDIVSTMVKTKMGNTIVVNYDMQLPRPYDNRWEIQGTEGLYNEQRKAVYLSGHSPKYEEWEPFDFIRRNTTTLGGRPPSLSRIPTAPPRMTSATNSCSGTEAQTTWS